MNQSDSESSTEFYIEILPQEELIFETSFDSEEISIDTNYSEDIDDLNLQKSTVNDSTVKEEITVTENTDKNEINNKSKKIVKRKVKTEKPFSRLKSSLRSHQRPLKCRLRKRNKTSN